jgi:OmpA-OmpF porin, OOP family
MRRRLHNRRSFAAPATQAAPLLLVQQRDGKVVLEGLLPDDATKAAILQRAERLYGSGNFIDHLKVDPQVASASWVAGAPSLLPAFGKGVSAGNARISGGEITVAGEVATGAIKTQIITDVSAAASPLNLKVNDQLTVVAAAPQPATPPAAPATTDGAPVPQALAAIKPILFANASAEIQARYRPVLNQVAKIMAASPGLVLEVAGHTDQRASSEYNEKLSRRRADAVRDYLIGKGVSADRLSAAGYGETKPVADNNTEAGRQQNRRVEFAAK